MVSHPSRRLSGLASLSNLHSRHSVALALSLTLANGS